MFQEIIQFFEDFGQIGMFIHSFIDAIFFPIPAFFLQVSLSVLNPKNALMLATIGYLASLLGTPVGYYIGKLVGNNFLQKIVKEKWITQASGLFKKNGEIAIFIGAFTPIPFKVFTILAGMFHFSLWKLLGYAALGRGVKFYIVGVIFHYFGRSSEDFVMSYLSLIMSGLAVLILIVYFFYRRNKRKKEKESPNS